MRDPRHSLARWPTIERAVEVYAAAKRRDVDDAGFL